LTFVFIFVISIIIRPCSPVTCTISCSVIAS
jgi:hypothetical protein